MACRNRFGGSWQNPKGPGRSLSFEKIRPEHEGEDRQSDIEASFLVLQDHQRLRVRGIGFPAPKAHLTNAAEFPVQKALSELHETQKEELGSDLILGQLGTQIGGMEVAESRLSSQAASFHEY